jgi:uncharacterized membrane protein
MILCWTAVLAGYAIARHERLNSTTYDLAIVAQVIWNTYLAPAVPFIFIAAIQGAHEVQKWLTPERARLNLTIYLGLATLLAWVRDNPFTQTVAEPFYEVKGQEQLSDARSFKEAAALLPDNAEVATMPNYGPHLALRSQLHIFHDRSRIFERPHGFAQTEYILIHLTDLRGDENTRFYYNGIQTALGNLGYGALYADNDVVLLQKGVDPQPLTSGIVLQRVQALLDGCGSNSLAVLDTVRQPAQKAIPSETTFENGIYLLAYEVPDSSAPGQPLCVTLYWQTETGDALDLLPVEVYKVE